MIINWIEFDRFWLPKWAQNRPRFWYRPAFQVKFDALESKFATKSISKIINFETLDPRRSPRCPQGLPKNGMNDLYPLFRVEFELIFDARIDQTSSQIRIIEKLASERGFWWQLTSFQDCQPRFGLAKPMVFVQFSFFAHRLPRDQLSGVRVQKWYQNSL